MTIFYEEYTNDFIRSYKEKTVYSLKEFENWFFGLCKGRYKDKISVPDPDGQFCMKEGPYRMDVNCMWEENRHYWVHRIDSNGKIIFSDGKLTDGMKHWNEDAKQLCREIISRRDHPKFDFG